MYNEEQEKKEGGFNCLACGEWVSFSDSIGTRHRNHCNLCFASRHVDLEISGDRKADCGDRMDAIGLTLKKEGVDKYGNPKPGELMLIHQCASCGKISINRIAGDDKDEGLMELFENSLNLPEEKILEIESQGIRVLDEGDRSEVRKRLFGK